MQLHQQQLLLDDGGRESPQQIGPGARPGLGLQCPAQHKEHQNEREWAQTNPPGSAQVYLMI